MRKHDAAEAAPIVERAMQNLLITISQHGRSGSDARTAIRALLVRLELLLRSDALGEPLDDAFDLSREAGATLIGIMNVRVNVVTEQPKTVGGKLIKDCIIMFCLATESRIISDMTFTSREDVEKTKKEIHSAYAIAAEVAADAMDAMSYRALVKAHAAISYFLVETARPLPRMLIFRFAAPLSTLHAGHRLYDDAGRADELRDENKVVHPAFMRHTGRALSA